MNSSSLPHNLDLSLTTLHSSHIPNSSVNFGDVPSFPPSELAQGGSRSSSRSQRRQQAAPYRSASMTEESPSSFPTHNVIPSNVYAPLALPLHAPQPLSFMARPRSLDRRGTYQASAGSFSNPELSSSSSLPGLWVSAPQNTFPTPSELLSGLAAQDCATHKEDDRARKADERRREQHEAVAETLGYLPTDPDAISTHDKKRYYLDSIEQYVLYLHHQLRLVGVEPVALERVSANRGLSSRSIRTMLVHMQRTAGKLHEQRKDAENKFNELSASLGSHEPSGPHGRHPISDTQNQGTPYQFP